jgi:sugar lactone lactonase YvrE
MKTSLRNPFLLPALIAGLGLILAGRVAAQSPPSVTLQPTNRSVAVPVGSNVSFAVSVAGTGPFSYQWQQNGTNLPNGIITTVAGNGTNGYSGDGGAATNAELNGPHGVAVDATGNLFIADCNNFRIRKVGANGIIATVAGNGTFGYSGDGGAATNAELYAPEGVTVDATGNLFIADFGNNRIRKVGANGIISTVAGNGTNGYFGDGGAATNAQLYAPFAVAMDITGNLFIADYGNNCIRKVGANGIITTVAGNGTNGYSGDGGAATNAELNSPYGVAVDASGNLLISDSPNNVIRKVGANGIITTVAGNGYDAGTGYGGYSGDGGAATNAELNVPHSVAVDASGNLFIADYDNNRIRKVGTNGIITTVAGNGTNGDSGDGGAATNAALAYPQGVAVDASGNLFIADSNNQRIRKVVIQGPTLVLNTVSFGNAGTYDVVVSSPYGSTTSSVVTLKVMLPPLSAPQATVGKTNFTFVLSGPAGSNYVLQVSTNLSNWSSVSTSTMPVSGSLTLTNAMSGYNRRFYRVFMQ